MSSASTLDEYRKYIEKDAALERRFQKILVDEPSVEDTIGILRGLQDKYELHHKVAISDAAIIAAAAQAQEQYWIDPETVDINTKSTPHTQTNTAREPGIDTNIS